MPEATLACPKCGGAWQTVKRDGVAIERRAGCQGVLLDRGELVGTQHDWRTVSTRTR